MARTRSQRLLWWLIWTPRSDRTRPTVSGLLLIFLALGVGSAAYNSSNNILFITLALVLSCLILSGILSWINFRRLEWDLTVFSSIRARETGHVRLLVSNTKRLVPSYALQFGLMLEPSETSVADSTFTVNPEDFRAAWKGEHSIVKTGELSLRGKLAAGTQTELEWAFVPSKRGKHRLSVNSVSSLFPFGFLKKSFDGDKQREILVWPARVNVELLSNPASVQSPGGQVPVAQIGTATDLFGLRSYQPGDSRRFVHWKASARLQRLMIRQYSAEKSMTYWVVVDPSDSLWSYPSQFDLLCSAVFELTEMLHSNGTLIGALVLGEEPVPVKHRKDLELFFDQLAMLEPRRRDSSIPFRGSGGRVTFEPNGPKGVYVCIDGQRIASA